MQNELIFQLYNLIYGILTSSTPRDTGNLLRHTVFNFDGKEATIEISAPKEMKNGETGDYFKYVNNYSKLVNKKPNPNYRYVQKAIIQACEIFAKSVGGVVVNEL